MKFIALLFLTLISTLRTQTASTVVKAAVGETVTVQCPQAGIQNSVIWCKANSKTRCNIIMSTNKYMDRNYDKRTSITNANGLISVTITQLQETDTGTYFCGPKHEISIGISDVILLKVFTDSWEPILSEVNGIMGNATTLPCLYSKQYKYYKKFLCQVTSENKCSIIASSNGIIGSLYNGRVSITTNNDHNFAVTMSSVSKGDKGEYWCGREKILDIEITQVKVLTIAEVTIGRPTDPSNTTSNTAQKIWYIILAAVLGLLILSLLVLFIWRKKRPKTTRNEDNIENAEPPIKISKFNREAEDMIIYSTVTIQPSAQTEGSSATYTNSKDLEKEKRDIKINSSESVEYSTLAFRS